MSVYGPFKSYYFLVLNAQLQQKPGVPLTIYDISGLVKIAHKKAMTPTNIIAGFKKLAYSPLDEHIFDKCDFLLSQVTDQPNDASTSNRHLKENESLDNVDFQLQDLGLLNDVEIHSLETFQNNFLSPEQVIGYLKAPRRKKRHQRRRKDCSMILTDTPQKELLKSCKKVQKAPK